MNLDLIAAAVNGEQDGTSFIEKVNKFMIFQILSLLGVDTEQVFFKVSDY